MNIGGLQKSSLIDFPQRICAVVFTRGCNFACPYCHNPNLLGHTPYSLAGNEDSRGCARSKGNEGSADNAGFEGDSTNSTGATGATNATGATGATNATGSTGATNTSNAGAANDMGKASQAPRASASRSEATGASRSEAAGPEVVGPEVVGPEAAGTNISEAAGAHMAKTASAHMDEGEVLDFLSRRVGLLDGVVISGGEPCLQADLSEFCRKLKSMGYEIKLDTNGSQPQVLEELINAKLLDYVAMDLKADPANYPPEISPKANPKISPKTSPKFSPAKLEKALLQSAEILKHSGLPYEFRTTCAEPFINNASIRAIAKFIAQTAHSDAVTLYLQKPNYNMVLNPQFHAGMVPPNDATMQAWRKIALEHIANCQLR